MKKKQFPQRLSLNKKTIAHLNDNFMDLVKGGVVKERCAYTAVNQSCPVVTMQPDTCIETCGPSFEYCYTDPQYTCKTH